MQTSRARGMRTLNDSLLDLVRRGLVEPREALRSSVQPDELEGLLRREGLLPQGDPGRP